MDSVVFTTDAERVIEFIGIIAFALSGAMLAIRKDFDVVGIVILAAVTALGGGVIRDVLIGNLPPIAFQRLDYLLLPLVAALLAMVAHPVIGRLNRSILLFDALGLALFTVNGTLLSLTAGIDPLPAAVLGVVTGVGGGVLRDVIAREVPLIVQRDTELYAIPALLGSLVVAYLHGRGLNTALVGLVAVALIFGVRGASMYFGWHAPGAWHRRAKTVD